MSDLFDMTIKPAFFSKLKPETQATYSMVINAAMNYCSKSFEDISADDARAFDKYLCDREEKGEIKHTTHVTHISILRSLGDFIAKCSFIDDYVNPFDSIIVKAVDEELSSSDIPSLDKVEMLLAACNDNDRLIFSLAAKCGLSTSEICSLKDSDVFTDEEGVLRGVTIRSGSRYHRNIKLPEDVLSLLSFHLRQGVSEYLFVNRRNNQMKPRDLQRKLQRYLTEIGIPSEFTVEDLRHCAIVYMKAGGATDNEIADYIGISHVGRLGARYRKGAYEDMFMAADKSLVNLSEELAAKLSEERNQE